MSVLTLDDTLIRKGIETLINNPQFMGHDEARKVLLEKMTSILKQSLITKRWIQGLPVLECSHVKLGPKKLFLTVIGRQTLVASTNIDSLRLMLKQFGNPLKSKMMKEYLPMAQGYPFWLAIRINTLLDKFTEQKTMAEGFIGKLNSVAANMRITDEIGFSLSADFASEADAQNGLSKLNGFLQTSQAREKWTKKYPIAYPDPKLAGTSLELSVSYPFKTLLDFAMGEMQKEIDALQQDHQVFEWANKTKLEKGLSPQALVASQNTARSPLAQSQKLPLVFSSDETDSIAPHFMLFKPDCSAAHTDIEMRTVTSKGKTAAVSMTAPKNPETKLTVYTFGKEQPNWKLLNIQPAAISKLFVDFKENKNLPPPETESAKPAAAFSVGASCTFKVPPVVFVK